MFKILTILCVVIFIFTTSTAPMRVRAFEPVSMISMLGMGLIAMLIMGLVGVVYVPETAEQITALGENLWEELSVNAGSSAEKLEELEEWGQAGLRLVDGSGSSSSTDAFPLKTGAVWILSAVTGWALNFVMDMKGYPVPGSNTDGYPFADPSITYAPDTKVAVDKTGYVTSSVPFNVMTYYAWNDHTSGWYSHGWVMWTTSGPFQYSNNGKLSSVCSSSFAVGGQTYYYGFSVSSGHNADLNAVAASVSYYATNFNYENKNGYSQVAIAQQYLEGAISNVNLSKNQFLPNAYVGGIQAVLADGTVADDIHLPDLKLNSVTTTDDSQAEVLTLMEQLSTGAITYEDYVALVGAQPVTVTQTDSDGKSAEYEVTNDSVSSEPYTGGDTGEDPDPGTDPDTWQPTGDIPNYTLDLKDYFPFCIPFDLYDFFTCLNADPVAPVIDWIIPMPGGDSYPLQLDLSTFDSVAQLLRRLQLLAFCIGLAFKTRDLIKG